MGKAYLCFTSSGGRSLTVAWVQGAKELPGLDPPGAIAAAGVFHFKGELATP